MEFTDELYVKGDEKRRIKDYSQVFGMRSGQRVEPFTDEEMPWERTEDKKINRWIKVLKRQIVSTHLVSYLFTTLIHKGFKASFSGNMYL